MLSIRAAGSRFVTEDGAVDVVMLRPVQAAVIALTATMIAARYASERVMTIPPAKHCKGRRACPHVGPCRILLCGSDERGCEARAYIPGGAAEAPPLR